MRKSFFSADRALLILAVAAAVFLAFIGGGTATYYKHFPYLWIKDAETAYVARKAKAKAIEEGLRTPLLVKSDPTPIVSKPGTFEGYTLYSTLEPKAYLMDMKGTVVYEWDAPFSKVWKKHPQVEQPLPDSRVYWHDATIFPNGDLLVLYHGKEDTPYGYGLAKLDRNSKVLWHYDENAHHKVNIASNGDIYALIHKIVPPPALPDIRFADSSIIHDWLVVLDASGKEKERISILQALSDSPYRELLKKQVSKPAPKGDPIHTNFALMLEPSLADAFPMFKPGQVLVSMRNIHAMGVLDISTRKFVWLATGPWNMQHDTKFLPDGTITIFDNHGSGRTSSRILKYNPATDETVVVFPDRGKRVFYTAMRGENQQLPNGNQLITASGQGKMIEVTPGKEIVWQFTNPFRLYTGRNIAPITVGKRYTRDQLPFLDKASE